MISYPTPSNVESLRYASTPGQIQHRQTSLVSAALLYTRMHVYAGMGVCICTVYMFMYVYVYVYM